MYFASLENMLHYLLIIVDKLNILIYLGIKTNMKTDKTKKTITPSFEKEGEGGRKERTSLTAQYWRPTILSFYLLIYKIMDKYGCRLFNALLALFSLVIFAPLFIVRMLIAKMRTGYIFEKTQFIGQYRIPFVKFTFADPSIGQTLPVLFNIIRGDMNFAGPRALILQEANQIKPINLARFKVKPGLYSTYRLRFQVGIAYQTEWVTDNEFVHTETFLGNLGIILRSLLHFSFKEKKQLPMPPTIQLFDIPIVNTTMVKTIDYIIEQAQQNHPTTLAFVNADCLNIAYKNLQYKQVLQKVSRVLPDGSGVRLGCRFLQMQLCDNVNGTDLFPQLCEKLANTSISIYLLGGFLNVARIAADNMQKKHPGLKIAGTQHGYYAKMEEAKIIEMINQTGAQILLVAFGAPKQELWIDQHRHQLKPTVCIGVGGLFDYYSERIPRAPLWMRELGLEWVWRLLQEPTRLWQRYLVGNPLFLYRIWKQKRISQTKVDTLEIHLNQSPVKNKSLLIINHETQSEMHIHSTLQTSINCIHDLEGKCKKSGNIFTPFTAVWQHWRVKSIVLGGRISKRLFDTIVAAILLLLFCPLLLSTMIAIYVTSPGPAFFNQIRVGKNGQLFKMYKFRSMYMNAEARKAALLKKNEMKGGILFKIKNDPRITPVGRFIRKYSIDEIPQLWNVLIGEMSLVGPRPALPHEVEQYTPYQRQRLAVTPGITCIWQVSGRSEIPFSRQVEMDLEYIATQSFFGDISLLLKTIPAVLKGRGAY